MIEFERVNKSYGKAHVLRNINLKIEKGTTTVVCGPSGSGKSTLIKTINGLLPIDSGTIKVDGKNCDAYQGVDLPKKVGMVFQDFGLFANKSVLDNLVVPQTVVHARTLEQATKKANQCLQQVSMLGHERKMPHQLSGGQQQRVAIARALASDPEYMLFDEPTSALDPEMVGEVLEVMVQLAHEGMTMMCVTHEMGFAKRVSNRLIFMDEGKILEDCPTHEFFDNLEARHERAKLFLEKIQAMH